MYKCIYRLSSVLVDTSYSGTETVVYTVGADGAIIALGTQLRPSMFTSWCVAAPVLFLWFVELSFRRCQVSFMCMAC